MANCESHIEIHKLPGSYQGGRLLSALDPEFVKVDERKIEDLILSTLKMSRNIKYMNLDNLPMGSWSAFFNWETTSIFAQIADYDINAVISNYKLLDRSILFIADLNDKKLVVANFFENFNSSVQDLKKKVDNLPSSFQIKEYFKATIPKIDALLQAILDEINAAADITYTLQHHLFNKKIHQIFGLLLDWKKRSHDQLYDNLNNYSEHSPHYALYLTFLKLFENAQNELNTFTKRHLDFYYNNILNLYPSEGTPDYAHLCITPHDNVPPFSIPKDSPFIAGKDSEGRSKYYTASADATINQSVISKIYGGLANSDNYYFEDLTELNAVGEEWQAFPNNTTQSLGLAIGSPLLYLKGGDREIRLSFNRVRRRRLDISESEYDFYLSGEEEWFKITAPIDDNKEVILNLSAEDPPIVAFDPEIHDGVAIDTPYPVLKIMSKSNPLESVQFTSVDITVTVNNFKDFKVFTDTGLVDHTKSFQPFGPFPRKGRSLIFSCNEFYQKTNATGSFNINYDNEFIRAGKTKRKGNRGRKGRFPGRVGIGWSFKSNTKLSHLINGVWTAGSEWSEGRGYNISNRTPIPFEIGENEPLTTKSAAGFSKITLNDKAYEGDSYLEKFIKQAKEDNPNLPYVPTIEEISFNYSASSTNNTVEFFHVLPKGYKKIRGISNYLLPVIENKGELFIGLERVEPGNAVSLLFQVAEGSANPRQLPVTPKWSYLDENGWQDFNADTLGDETNGMTCSGIINFKAPEDLDMTLQTNLPKNYWWIRMEVEDRVDAICNLLGIHAQALKVVLSDYEESGVKFEENLEAKTISKLFRPLNQIKSIEQPYSSFSGRVSESTEIFYQRTSERLRHKNRSITNWDYERLVLDNFPQVFSVKCLNHYRYDAHERHNMSAGYVTVVPIAQAAERNVQDNWKPLVDIGTMNKIQSFLEAHSSPHVRIMVKPPVLEKLDITFNVKYHDIPGADSRLFTDELRAALNKFLSPWAYKDQPATFQNEIQKSHLIHLIEQHHFVDYINDFKVNHLFLFETSNDIDPTKTRNNVERTIPSTPYSLFVPNEHNIDVITEICCT